MKAKIKIEKEVELKTLIVKASVRYYEDDEVDGIEDKKGDLIPCKVGDLWCPIIDIDTGVITNWAKGRTANIHYKVCDECGWDLLDEKGNIVMSVENEYVPDTLAPEGGGYGDYIKMKVDENGKINKWDFDIEDFQDEE